MTTRVHHSLPRTVGVRRSNSAARTWRNGCAWMLALLAALPFTAPFSTIDLGMLLGTEPAAVARAAHQPSALHPPELDSQQNGSPGALLDEDMFKDVTVTPTVSVAPVILTATVTRAQHHPASSVRAPLLTLRL